MSAAQHIKCLFGHHDYTQEKWKLTWVGVSTGDFTAGVCCGCRKRLHIYGATLYSCATFNIIKETRGAFICCIPEYPDMTLEFVKRYYPKPLKPETL